MDEFKNETNQSTSHPYGLLMLQSINLGKILFQQSPGLSEQEVALWSRRAMIEDPQQRRTHTRYVLIGYQQAKRELLLSLERETSNTNQMVTSYHRKEQSKMGTNIQRIKDNAGKTHFVKPRELYDNDCVFVIKSCDSAQSNYGTQWKLLIELDTEDLEPESVSPNDTFILTLSGGGRDSIMRDLRAQLRQEGPAYNCYMDMQRKPNGQEFFDVCQLQPGDEGYKEPPVDETATKSFASLFVKSDKKSGRLKRDHSKDDFLDDNY